VLEKGKAGAIMAAALDGRPLAESSSALIVACGRCENRGMGFSADRRTVGSQWGTGPVHVEPLQANLPWPNRPAELTALSPDGTPAARVPVNAADTILKLKPEHKTIWYQVKR